MNTYSTISALTALLLTVGTLAFSQSSFTRHTISSSIGQPMDLCVMDVNKDGQKDLITVSSTGGEISWWENQGQEMFIKHPVKTGFAGGRSVRAGDLDGDRDIDLIAASYSGNKIEWYENNGSQVFSGTILDGNFRGAHTVQLIDLDQDGDLDVVCSGWDNTPAKSEIAWWENLGGKQFSKHLVSDQLDQSPFVDVADMDGDGDLDMVGADETTGEVYWWSNSGQGIFTEHFVDGEFSLAHTVVARDIDKDGDMDILGAACTSSLLSWYENKGAGAFEKRSLPSLGGAIWMDMADFDLDGDNDMVATGMAAGQLAFFANNGQQVFTRSWIEGGLASGFALNVADIDNDQDMDIAAIGYNSNFLGWWENTITRTSLVKAPGWICRGPGDDGFFVVNNDKGNIILIDGLCPVRGISNPKVCQGILYRDNKLYAAVGSEIVAYNPDSGVRIASYRTDAQYLEDLTADPSGLLFASAPLDGKILLLNSTNGQSSLLAEGLDYPKAIKYDPGSGQILILDGEESVTVKSADPFNGEIRTLKQTLIRAGGDIESDGSGNYYISSPGENVILAITDNGAGEPFRYMTDLDGPWGLCYDANEKELVVAMNSGDRIQRIPATATGVPEMISRSKPEILAFPNPFGEYLNLHFPDGWREDSEIQLISPEGCILLSKKKNHGSPDAYTQIMTLDLTGLSLIPCGLYFVRWSGKSETATLPLIHCR